MDKTIHRLFTKELLYYFEVDDKQRKRIADIDYHQDDYYFKSLAHFYPSSKKVLIKAIKDYENDMSDESLGRCLHFVVDMSTPFHYIRSFSPGVLVHHRAFEAIGKALLRRKIKQIIRRSVLTMPNLEYVDMYEHIDRIEELQLRRFLKFVRVFNALRRIRGLREISKNLNAKRLVAFLLDPSQAFTRLVFFIEDKNLNDPTHHLHSYYIDIKHWDIERIEKEMMRTIRQAVDDSDKHLSRKAGSQVELLLIQWVKRYYYDCIGMAVPLAYMIIQKRFNEKGLENFKLATR